jgi:hypothetical protein
MGASADPAKVVHYQYPMPDSGHPLALSPYSTFLALRDRDLREIQVKVTYLGFSMSQPYPPIAFALAADSVDLKRFRPFWRKRVSYEREYKEPIVSGHRFGDACCPEAYCCPAGRP